MIGRVEKLGAELELVQFVKLERLENRRVPVDQSRPHHRVTSYIPQSSRGHALKDVPVKPPVGAAHVVRRQRRGVGRPEVHRRVQVVGQPQEASGRVVIEVEVGPAPVVAVALDQDGLGRPLLQRPLQVGDRVQRADILRIPEQVEAVVVEGLLVGLDGEAGLRALWPSA